MKNKSYIVKTAVRFPQIYNSKEIVDNIYNESLTTKYNNRFARRFSSSTRIDSRCIAFDVKNFPDKHVNKENEPLAWLSFLHNSLTKDINEEINFLSVSYNMGAGDNFLPNISSQLCNRLNITTLTAPPEEFNHVGCASGIFSIDAASGFCAKERQGLSFVASIEQCSWFFGPEYNNESPDFIPSLRSHAIFGDASAGLLIAGEEVADRFTRKCLIVDTQLFFQPGDAIGMKNGRFLIGDKVQSVMPQLVAKQVITPLLARNHLTAADITQWSIHQGSHMILDEFKREDVLGLTAEQIEKSHQFFSKYGNVSSASALIVFDDWFSNGDSAQGEYGIILGFGAGYYLGAVLYQWC